MTTDIRVAVTIRVPRPEIAAVMFNPRFAPSWIGGVKSIHIESGEPPALGSIFAVLSGAALKKRAEIFEITEYVPDRSLTMESDDRVWHFELEGAPVGMIVWLSVWEEPTGLRRLLAPLQEHWLRRAVIRDLRRLKRLMESGEYRRLERET